jgi:hypothetical protein
MRLSAPGSKAPVPIIDADSDRFSVDHLIINVSRPGGDGTEPQVQA